MKNLIFVLLISFLGCSPKITTPEIKKGIIISVNDTVVDNQQLKVIWYYTDELQRDMRLLYPVTNLKPGAVFNYIKDR